MQNNLHTTIKAYVKLSPSVLSNYVETEDLKKQLQDYVKEAPTDGFTYGRRNKEWVELEATAVRNVRLRWGTSLKETFALVEGQTGSDDITNLEFRQDIYKEGQDKYIIRKSLPITSRGYGWVCCSHKILSIQCDLGGGYMGPWDYEPIPEETVTGADGIPYYCYRTVDILSAGYSWELLIEINAHKESD